MSDWIYRKKNLIRKVGRYRLVVFGRGEGRNRFYEADIIDPDDPPMILVGISPLQCEAQRMLNQFTSTDKIVRYVASRNLGGKRARA